MPIHERKAPPLSLPCYPVCNSQTTILESVNYKGVPQEWEVVCNQDDHFIRVSGPTEAEAIEQWKKAFSKCRDDNTDKEREILSRIKHFMNLYGVVFYHTETSLGPLANLVSKLGHCPCNPNRPPCPCPSAIDEINSQGHCNALIFWDDKSEAYKNWGGKR